MAAEILDLEGLAPRIGSRQRLMGADLGSKTGCRRTFEELGVPDEDRITTNELRRILEKVEERE